MKNRPFNLTMGPRGEGWVLVQAVLFASLLVIPPIPDVRFPFAGRLAGGVLLLLAGALGSLSLLHLGRNLTPFPKPRAEGELVQHGTYAVVRHPIYTAIVFGTLGGAVLLEHVPGMAMSLVLFLFFDLKSRHEERMLRDKFPEYDTYRSRVKKLVPWIY
ncbi:isoprenylcysteine carboxylmethyltransferase family protein [bacterium]|nr:isoprenylcysteine carboxylmethyltransferase family protein [bacterium]